jgi:hypothetical protein
VHKTSREAGIVTTRFARRGIFNRATGIAAAAMAITAFALGYILHPM